MVYYKLYTVCVFNSHHHRHAVVHFIQGKDAAHLRLPIQRKF